MTTRAPNRPERTPRTPAAAASERLPAATAARHPIGVVCRRTGLKPDLVRAWEKRYGAVAPGRGQTARRLYSDADIERISLLHRATQGGRGIGQIARLDNAELERLIAADEAASRTRSVTAEDALEARGVHGYFEASLDAVAALDGQRLRYELDRAAAKLTRRRLIEDVLVPLVHALGEQWREGSIRPVHEHLATTIVKSFLGNLQGAFRTPYWAPNLVVTTPAGQQHEIGALLVGATAAAEGWYVAYLGPNLPAEDIALAAHEIGARAVALSIVHPADDPALPEELRRLRRLLNPDVAIIAGGRATQQLAPVLDEILVSRPQSLDALCEVLGQLRNNPPPRAQRPLRSSGAKR
jgi:methanogenic corrinoid protein MtbC1